MSGATEEQLRSGSIRLHHKNKNSNSVTRVTLQCLRSMCASQQMAIHVRLSGHLALISAAVADRSQAQS
jgi:hypothetical protein